MSTETELFSAFETLSNSIRESVVYIAAGGFGAAANRFVVWLRADRRKRRTILRFIFNTAIYIFIGSGIGFFISHTPEVLICLVAGALWPYLVEDSDIRKSVIKAVRKKLMMANTG